MRRQRARTNRRDARRRIFTRHTARVCVCVDVCSCVGVRAPGRLCEYTITVRVRCMRPATAALLRVSVMRQCKPSAGGSRRRGVVGVSPKGGWQARGHRGSRRCRWTFIYQSVCPRPSPLPLTHAARPFSTTDPPAASDENVALRRAKTNRRIRSLTLRAHRARVDIGATLTRARLLG